MAVPTRSKELNINPLRLGSLEINFPVGLAPMAGISNSIFRSICKDFNCGFSFTEAVNTVDPTQEYYLSHQRLAVEYEESPLGVQIFGSQPETMAESALRIEDLGRFDMIDINCGCPASKIVAKGAGAALMNSPKRIREIVHAVSRAVSVPVTLKTRIGVSPLKNNIEDIARAAEEGGASAITIHARYATDKHEGPADWKTLRRIKSLISIPVIGNGGIRNADDALEMFTRTGVDGLMIGRAAIGNPWIFNNIHRLLKGETVKPHTPVDRLEVMLKHLEGLTELMRKERHLPGGSFSPEQKAALHFRTFLVKYLDGFDGSMSMRRKLPTMDSPSIIIKELKKLIPAV